MMKNEMKTNNKRIRLLAVLAVLAMAFAAFAVLASAEEQDAAFADEILYDNEQVTLTGAEENFKIFVNKNADVTATLTGTTIKLSGTIPYMNGSERVGTGANNTNTDLFGNIANGKAGYIIFNKSTATTNFKQTGNNTLKTLFPAYADGTKTSDLDDDKAVVVLVDNGNGFKVKFDTDSASTEYTIDVTGLRVGGNVVAVGDKGESYTIGFPGNNYAYASGAVSGYGGNNATADNYKALSGMDGVPEASIYSFAMIGIDGMTSKVKNASNESANTVKITSESTVWATFGNYAGVKADKDLRERTFAIADDVFSGTDHYLSVMVPQDKSSVKLTFAYYKTTVPGTIGTTDVAITTTTFTIDFSGAYTYVALAGDVEGIGYEFSGKILTLTNFDGNVGFDGDINQVTLSGDNVLNGNFGDVAYENGIRTTADSMKVKPVEGTGSLAIIMNSIPGGVMNGIQANALSIEGSDIQITIISKDDKAYGAYGIYTSNDDISVYESSIEISLDAANDTAGIAIGTGKLDIKSSLPIEITAKSGITAAKVSIAASAVEISSSIVGINATSIEATKNTLLTVAADISVPNFAVQPCGIRAAQITAESDSIITVDNLRLKAGEPTTSTNNAIIAVTGDLIVDTGAKLVNKSTFGVGGKTLIVGELDNQGTFVASGDVKVSKFKTSITPSVEFPGAPLVNSAGTLATEYYIVGIDINAIELNADNTAFISSMDVKFKAVTGEAANFEIEGVKGTAAVDADGNITAMSFIVTSINGDTQYQAPVSVSWVVDAESSTAVATKYMYAVDASGQVYETGANPYVVVPSKLGNLEEGCPLLAANAAAVFKATAGTFTASEAFYVEVAQANLVNGGELVADVTTDVAITLAKGTLTGDVKSAKAGANITIQDGATLTGDIELAKASDVTINNGGTLAGNILSKDKASTITIDGKMTGDISVTGKYKSKAEVTTPDVEYTATISAAIVSNKTAGQTVIKTVAAAGTTPGFIAITKAGAVAKDKTSSIIVKEGTFEFQFAASPADVIPSGFDFTAKSGSTVNIKSATTVSVVGAIVIVEGATFNVYDAEKKVYNYGKIDNEITFTVAPNTYYCSFEYALGNAPEGTPLEVSKDVTINKDITVKKDVDITVAANKTVTFTGKTLAMSEGASIDLMDGASVKFAAAAEATKNVSGVFTYGLNAVVLSNVYFTAGENTIVATKATGSTSVDKVTLDVKGYNAGSIELAVGDFAGNIVFVSKDMGTVPASYTTGAFTIDEFSEYTGTFDYDAERVAKIVNNGTYAPTADVPAIDVKWEGTGIIFLGEGKKVSIKGVADVAAVNVLKQNMTITDGTNMLELTDVFSGADLGFTAVKGTTTVPAHILFSDNADALYGDITAYGNIEIGTFELAEKGVIAAEEDSVVSITNGKTVVATGLLKIAGTINMKTETVTTYGTLNYQVQYTEGAYTVYSQLGTAITEGGVSEMSITEDIVLAGGATPATAKNLGNVALDIADGKKLTLTGYVSIGTATTSLGGVIFGISGNVVLANDADVLIVYDSASVDESKIWTNADMTVMAKKSAFIVEKDSSVYAVAYNNGGATLANVEACMNPQFDGYRFTGYAPYVGGATMVGQSDVAIKLDAGKVSVVLSKVVGATYYVNNVAYKQMGVPVDLKVGDVVSAAPNTGYEGDVKVNGQEFIVVDTSTMVITATGMTPAPEPEPTPAEKKAFGITEALLIVLVIMIAILVIIVVFRMMRS